MSKTTKEVKETTPEVGEQMHLKYEAPSENDPGYLVLRRRISYTDDWPALLVNSVTFPKDKELVERAVLSLSSKQILKWVGKLARSDNDKKDKPPELDNKFVFVPPSIDSTGFFLRHNTANMLKASLATLATDATGIVKFLLPCIKAQNPTKLSPKATRALIERLALKRMGKTYGITNESVINIKKKQIQSLNKKKARIELDELQKTIFIESMSKKQLLDTLRIAGGLGVSDGEVEKDTIPLVRLN